MKTANLCKTKSDETKPRNPDTKWIGWILQLPGPARGSNVIKVNFYRASIKQ